IPRPSRAFPVGVPVLIRTRSVHDHAPDALALVHQLEPLADVRQRHGVRDHRIDLDLALHVPVDDFRHVGAAARAAEGGALPGAAGDQLEGAGCDLRASRRDADDDGLAPPAMAGFERLAHHRDVAGAVEGVVGAADLVSAALCHVDECATKSLPTSFGLTKCVMPKRSPHCFLALLMSTPMIMSAP